MFAILNQTCRWHVFYQHEECLQIARYEMPQSSCKRDTKSKSHPGTETRTGTSFALRFDPSNSLGKQFFHIRLHSRNSLARPAQSLVRKTPGLEKSHSGICCYGVRGSVSDFFLNWFACYNIIHDYFSQNVFLVCIQINIFIIAERGCPNLQIL